jgi:hypothetical protein
MIEWLKKVWQQIIHLRINQKRMSQKKFNIVNERNNTRTHTVRSTSNSKFTIHGEARPKKCPYTGTSLGLSDVAKTNSGWKCKECGYEWS